MGTCLYSFHFKGILETSQGILSCKWRQKNALGSTFRDADPYGNDLNLLHSEKHSCFLDTFSNRETGVVI